MPAFETVSRPVARRAPRKIQQTFRLPPKLVAFIQEESSRCGLNATDFVTQILDGYRTDYGLPAAARAVLDEDRQALGLEPDQYILHALFQRQLELRDKGVGFDGPRPSAVIRRADGKG
jgi:hypothetical protein